MKPFFSEVRSFHLTTGIVNKVSELLAIHSMMEHDPVQLHIEAGNLDLIPRVKLSIIRPTGVQSFVVGNSSVSLRADSTLAKEAEAYLTPSTPTDIFEPLIQAAGLDHAHWDFYRDIAAQQVITYLLHGEKSKK